jgi:hypothetical protein
MFESHCLHPPPPPPTVSGEILVQMFITNEEEQALGIPELERNKHNGLEKREQNS